MNGQPAIFLLHPSAPKPELHDPRDPFVRDRYEGEPQTPEQLELLAVTDGLTTLIQKHGAARIMRLVRMLAHLAGQEV
jgi:hypothetical protein